MAEVFDVESQPSAPQESAFQVFWKVWGETVVIASGVCCFLIVPCIYHLVDCFN